MKKHLLIIARRLHCRLFFDKLPVVFREENCTEKRDWHRKQFIKRKNMAFQYTKNFVVLDGKIRKFTIQGKVYWDKIVIERYGQQEKPIIISFHAKLKFKERYGMDKIQAKEFCRDLINNGRLEKSLWHDRDQDRFICSYKNHSIVIEIGEYEISVITVFPERK